MSKEPIRRRSGVSALDDALASETVRRKTTRGRRRAWALVENESQRAADSLGIIGSGDVGYER